MTETTKLKDEITQLKKKVDELQASNQALMEQASLQLTVIENICKLYDSLPIAKGYLK